MISGMSVSFNDVIKEGCVQMKSKRFDVNIDVVK